MKVNGLTSTFPSFLGTLLQLTPLSPIYYRFYIGGLAFGTSLQNMPGSVGAVAAAKKKKKSGTENLEKAFEKADISSDGKVSLL